MASGAEWWLMPSVKITGSGWRARNGGPIIASGPVRPCAAPGSHAAPWRFGPRSTLIGQKIDKTARV
jgi:hypothetical protein